MSRRWPIPLFALLGACSAPVPADTPSPTPSQGTPGQISYLESTNALCSDGIDNDHDGYTDCGDRACIYTGSVTICGDAPGPESSNAACSDGVSNDGDPFVDCADNGCLYNADVTVCDRDRDGYSGKEGDCMDHPTLDISRAVSPTVPEMCGDGIDNDCDGVAEESACIQLDLGWRTVSQIYDGDTINVEGVGSIRFKGIDTPESYAGGDDGVECYGLEAKARTTALINHGLVRVVMDPVDYADGFRDLYDRLLAHIYTSDETYLNGALVGEGYACVWQSFECSKKVELLELQDAAQDGDIGLWGACGGSVCF